MTKMPYARQWQRVLAGIYGDHKSRDLISKAKSVYAEYSHQQARQVSKANRQMLAQRILPGLSIYKVLLKENGDREKALKEVEILMRKAFFTTRMQGIRLLNYLHDPFPLVRPALKMMARDEYLPGSQEIIEDSADCFAFTVYRCFILDVLAENDAAELTALYCKTDDWLAESLPVIRWERTRTLGRGDDCCDFRWRRK